MADAKTIVKHDGDCSIWDIDCEICDCGALRRAVSGHASDKQEDLLLAWVKHQIAIDRSLSADKKRGT